MIKSQTFRVAVLILGCLVGTGHADQVILKSGARGDLSVSVEPAPDDLGGPSSGNILGLKVALASGREPNPDVDGLSLCHLHGTTTYKRMRNDNNLRATLQDLVDLDAPLVAVLVDFLPESVNGVSFAPRRHFDMRGLSKCRPFEG